MKIYYATSSRAPGNNVKLAESKIKTYLISYFELCESSKGKPGRYLNKLLKQVERA